MKAKVNPETCIGCELCAQTCPEAFEMNDEGIAVTKGDTVPTDAEQSAQDAAGNCPVDAIELD